MAQGGVLPPPTSMAIASALAGLLTATATPEMTWLTTSSWSITAEVPTRTHIGRARLGLVRNRCLHSHRLDVCKVAAVARDVLLSQSARGGMTRC